MDTASLTVLFGICEIIGSSGRKLRSSVSNSTSVSLRVRVSAPPHDGAAVGSSSPKVSMSALPEITCVCDHGLQRFQTSLQASSVVRPIVPFPGNR
eukprot:7942773-Pyramimonas_sp.AAC.1